MRDGGMAAAHARGWWASLAAALVLGGVALGQAGDVRPYLTANGLLNRGLYELAIPEYEAFLGSNPGHDKADSARYGLAVCHFRLGRYDEALAALDGIRTGERFEFAAEVRLLRGHCLLTKSAFGAAGDEFEAVVRGHAEHAGAPGAASLLAEARYREGRHEEAIAAARLVESRWPDSPERDRTELFRGLAEGALGRHVAAAERFSWILERSAEGPVAEQAEVLLARSLHSAGRADEAKTRYRKVLERNVERYMPEALLGLAQLVHAEGDLRESAALLDRLLERHAESPLADAARLERGRVWFDAGDHGRARRLFDEVSGSQDAGLRDDADYWIGKCMLRQGDHAGAAARFAEAIGSHPSSELIAEMRYDRAVALSRAGEDRAAAAALEEFGRLHPEHAMAGDAMFTRASIEHGSGNYDVSIRLVREFLASHPEHALVPEAIFMLGENEYLVGRYDRAESVFRDAMERFDGDVGERARFRLAMTLARLGRFDEAEPHLLASTDGRRTRAAFRPALLALGDGYFARGDWERAEAALTEYAALGPDEAEADDALLKLGLAQARQGRPLDALRPFEAVIDGFPESPHRAQAIFERGQAQVALGEWGEAKAAFERVVSEAGDSRFAPYAMKHLGAIARRENDPVKAAEWYERAANVGGAEIAREATLERGQALLAAKRYPEAIASLTRVVEDREAGEIAVRARAARAIALARGGELERALAEIDATAKSRGVLDDATLGTLAYERAWCLRELGRGEEAISQYRDLLARSPRPDIRAYALLDLAALEMGGERFTDAAPLLEELQGMLDATEGLPTELHEQTAYRRGVCALREGRFADVVAALATFHERFPESGVAHSADLMCGEAYLKLNQHQRATAYLERVVSKHPESESCGPALLRLAEARATLQHWARSEEAFRTYLERFGDSESWFQARFGLGWARENQGRYEEAIRDYTEVASRHQGPTAARSQFQIGECLFAQKRHEDAVREFLRVDILYAYPEWSAAALYEAGRCFEEMNRIAEAREQYGQVLERFGRTEWARQASQRLERLATSPTPGRGG